MLDWWDYRQSNFGFVDKKKQEGDPEGTSSGRDQWLFAQIFKQVSATSELTLSELQTPVRDLSLTKSAWGEKTRGYVCWAVTMYRLIQADPDRFKGAAAPFSSVSS